MEINEPWKLKVKLVMEPKKGMEVRLGVGVDENGKQGLSFDLVQRTELKNYEKDNAATC